MAILINCQPNALPPYASVELDIDFIPVRDSYDLVLNHWQKNFTEGKKTLGYSLTKKQRLAKCIELNVPVFQVFSRLPENKIVVLKGDRLSVAYKTKDINPASVTSDTIIQEFTGTRTLYKIETLNGEYVTSWQSGRPSIYQVPYCKSDKYKIDFWEEGKEVLDLFQPLCDFLKLSNAGYVSFDIMKDELGNFKIIEYNDNFVALWYSNFMPDWNKNVENILRKLYANS